MRNWIKEKPLIETEGLIKGLHPISSTKSWVIQPLREEINNSMSDWALALIRRAPRKDHHIDSFVQVGVPIQKIVEDLLSQRNRGLNG